MSLKGFHLFFIAASTALSVAVGVWGVRGFLAGSGRGALVLGCLFLLTALVLAVYGRRFVRKYGSLGS